eukprot:CAMPEP_0117604848 /NCGR_PEP_ID=MMETSP0784-20121206/78894_1 /TAXON_ID=39447 /ORGANISM="" /LENGTH=301 /DNA_ID=CAMNT_0005407883 /DNA_START=183 /DNA_END=1088 /DNA_ORIENTATION=+
MGVCWHHVLDIQLAGRREPDDPRQGGLRKEEGVLIHSFQGESRSCCVLAAYLMQKYRWSLRKTLEFMKSRGLGTEIKMGFMHQLQSFEKRLVASHADVPLGREWCDLAPSCDPEELLISNTFVNVRSTAMGEEEETKPTAYTGKPQPAGLAGASASIRWSDAAQGGRLTEEQEAPEPLTSEKQDDEPRDGRAAKKAATVAIQTRSRIVHCSAAEIVPQRVGLRFRSSSIILEYEVPSQSLRAHHVIEVNFESGGAHADFCDKAASEKLRRGHAPWLDGVSTEQLVALVGRLRCARSAAGGS